MSSTSVVVAVRPTASNPQGGPPSVSPTLVVAAARPTDSTPREPAIVIFSFSGDRCRTCRQHPQGPALTSPTLVVATAGPTASTP
jgi:hypothetical protein